MSATRLAVLLVALCLRTAAAQKEGDLRLVGGAKCGEGRVEIYHSREWGTVCDDRFDLNDARVICRQLGYREPKYVWFNAFFGQGTGPIWVDGLNCRGSESRLVDCSFNGFGIHDCRHHEDAGVTCGERLIDSAPDLPTRITCPPNHQGACNTCPTDDGPVAVQGIVEELLEGQWRPVSGQEWTIEGAHRVCDELGFPRAVSIPSLSTLWPNWEICGLQMRGSGESPLLGCSPEQREYLESLRNTTVHHNECQGSCCFLSRTLAQTSLSNVSVATVACAYSNATASSTETYRLRGGPLPWMGRVEVRINGIVGTICDLGWNKPAASVVCRALGYGSAAELYSRSYFGRGGGRFLEFKPIHYTNVKCTTGREALLSQCENGDYDSGCHSHIRDAGVRCNVPDRSSCANKKPNTVRLTSRFVRNREVLRTLEVLHNGRWGRVCGRLKNQRSFATTVCRETMGMFAAQVHNISDSRYSGVNFTAIFGCTGNELMAVDCRQTIREVARCSDGYVAIQCSSDLPDLVPNLDQFRRSLVSNPYITQSYLTYLKCAQEEKCLARSAEGLPRYALRSLLKFDSLTMNYGRADFKPNLQSEDYLWHSCHQHFHSFERFVDYDILSQLGFRVADGHKASFCLEDSICDTGSYRRFSCSRGQGISVNCGDLYRNYLDCQWIDVSDVRSGRYIIRQFVNPSRESFESDYLNNEIRCVIDLDAPRRRYRVRECKQSDH